MYLRLDGRDDRRVSMPDNHHTEPVVEVHVLVAVHVPDMAALAVIDEDGLRRRVLERARDAARDVLGCLLPQLARTCPPRPELGFLVRGQGCNPIQIDVTQGQAHRTEPSSSTCRCEKFY